jgi:predicted secreted Zn-dependent protease
VRLEASFSAVGLFVLLALADSELSRLFAPLPEPAEPIEMPHFHSGARLVEKVRNYQFFGARAADAGSSLRQRLLVTSDYQGRESRFTGQTDWHIEWRACFEQRAGRCAISGVQSTVHVTYTLPRWADRDSAPAHLRDRWDRYILSLSAHEKGHGAIALEVARLIEAALVGQSSEESCDRLNADAVKIVDEVMHRGEAMQREYDRVTRHGSSQGAQFPF